jgi:hypothetical protein
MANDEEDEAPQDIPKTREYALKDVVTDAEEQMRMWLRTWLGAIYEALLMNPTDVMTKEPWLPLQAFLSPLTTDVDAGALHAWLEIDSRKGAQEWIASDTKNRAHLRTTLMLLLCAESDASSQPEKVIRAVAAALGIDGKKLDKKLDKKLVPEIAALQAGEFDCAIFGRHFEPLPDAVQKTFETWVPKSAKKKAVKAKGKAAAPAADDDDGFDDE